MPHLSFHLGPPDITGLGVMVALGAAAGLWVFQKELAARFLADRAVDVGMAGVTGGLIGAKLLYVLEHVGREPVAAGLVSRGGMSWFGGMIGGALLLPLPCVFRCFPWSPRPRPRWPSHRHSDASGASSSAMTTGGRATCPGPSPFPKGYPLRSSVSTQLYEALFLALLAAALWHWRRTLVPDRAIAARYCLLAGGFRFLVEFIRLNARVTLGLTVAQWASLLLVAAGTAVAWSGRSGENAQRRPSPRTGAS